MSPQKFYITDPEEIRLFLDTYPRLNPEQLLVSLPVRDGKPLELCPCPAVRGLVEAFEPPGTVTKIALHVMAIFHPRNPEEEPRLCFEYFSRGYPDPQEVPPVFFSTGARECIWALMLLETGLLGMLDRKGGQILIQLEEDQTASVRLFTEHALIWWRRHGADPFEPGPFPP